MIACHEDSYHTLHCTLDVPSTAHSDHDFEALTYGIASFEVLMLEYSLTSIEILCL